VNNREVSSKRINANMDQHSVPPARFAQERIRQQNENWRGVVEMDNSTRVRTKVAVISGLLFIISLGITVYQFSMDRKSDSISWLFTLCIFLFFVMVLQFAVVVIKRRS
jgi:hypothetical protein